MSAPRKPLLASIIVPFTHALLSVSKLQPGCRAHILQRGVAAIVHSYSVTLLCTASTETALESAQTAADRFQQFVTQATAEKHDTSLLCEAFSFALRGTTFSRMLDDHPPLTNSQATLLLSVQAEHQAFVDKLLTLSESADADLAPILGHMVSGGLTC
jgi:hypothetical protein